MIASPALWRTVSARGRIFTPMAQTRIADRYFAGEEFVRGVSAGPFLRRPHPRKGERSACEMSARKHGRSASLSLRPTRNPGADARCVRIACVLARMRGTQDSVNQDFRGTIL